MSSSTFDETDIGFATAVDLRKGYAAGDYSPAEVTEAILARVARLDPAINALSAVSADMARAAAADSGLRIRAGTARMLEGVPVTIKEFYDLEGFPSETFSPSVRSPVAQADNPVVARLRAAGAVVIGKTTMSEFAWSGLSRNPVTGITHNPWGQGLNAGASSAGAGAAAAAGYGPLHLGSDGAGSIRMPAHFCGVFGLKPTFGRVPHVPLSNNDHATYIGPMSRTVADSALMLEVMSGPHHADPYSCEAPPAGYLAALSAGFKGKRIAFSADLGHARVDPEIAAIVAEAVAVLDRDLGAHVEAVTPAWGPKGASLGRFFWVVLQGQKSHLLDDWADQMGADLVAAIRAGQNFTAREFLDHRREKYDYITEMAAFLEDWDYLVTPVCSVAAFPAERVLPAHWPDHAWDWLSWSEFLYPFNMSGQPAASVPCGFTAAGLPVGLQIVGKRFDDLGVLQLAAAFEAARPLHAQRPAITFAL